MHDSDRSGFPIHPDGVAERTLRVRFPLDEQSLHEEYVKAQVVMVVVEVVAVPPPLYVQVCDTCGVPVHPDGVAERTLRVIVPFD